MPRRVARSVDAKLSKVRLFLCDVDGVLTNATVLIGDGREFKEFHIQDGLGLRLLQRGGVKVGRAGFPTIRQSLAEAGP
jgi:3-deoxy-D-manno-octulosonate 8-phosphate phosphatase (KDO 8-P phosphatase)